MKKSIDKFGHVRGYQSKIGPPGVGFALNSDGNFDLQQKILTNVTDPVNDQDVVTKAFLKRKLENTLNYDNSVAAFDCQAKRITGVKNPEQESDVVNIKYLKNTTLNSLANENFDAKNKRIKSVAEPTEVNDAVNLAYLNLKVLPELVNVKEPKKDSDAVNYKFLKDTALLHNDAKGHRLVNVGKAVEKNDAVNLDYIDLTLVPKILHVSLHVRRGENHYDAKSKLISHVHDPEDSSDVLNLRTFKQILKAHEYFIMKHMTEMGIIIQLFVYDTISKLGDANEFIKTATQHKESLSKHDDNIRKVYSSFVDGKSAISDSERKQISKVLQVDEKYIKEYLKK